MTHGPPRPLRWPHIGVLLSVVVLGLAACSSTPIADPPTTESTVIVTVPSTTTTSGSDPGADSDAPTTSETTVEDVEAAVREVHTRFMTELFARDERVVGPEAILVLGQELTTGRVFARLQETIETKQESGDRSVSLGFRSNILSVEIDESSAIVLDCSQDRSERYSADGELLVPADDYFKYRETWLVLEGDLWLVEEFIVGGDLRCDPDDLV